MLSNKTKSLQMPSAILHSWMLAQRPHTNSILRRPNLSMTKLANKAANKPAVGLTMVPSVAFFLKLRCSLGLREMINLWLGCHCLQLQS